MRLQDLKDVHGGLNHERVAEASCICCAILGLPSLMGSELWPLY